MGRQTNINTATITNSATGTGSKSIYIGIYPAGVNWGAVGTEALKMYLNKPVGLPAIRSLLLTSIGGRLVVDVNNSGGLDLSDVTGLIGYSNNSGSLSTASREWIQANIEKPMTENPTAYIAEGSYYNANDGSPVAAIYGGGNTGVLADPTANMSSLFFHSDFDYLRIKNIVDFTITLPGRNTRTTGGGKKSGPQLMSYNGYSDIYIYEHNYGNPPPAFSVFLKNDSSNGAVAGLALTGSIPLQYNSNNTFRLGLAYSTEKYLVIRERFQVYNSNLAPIELFARAYFYENPTSVTGATGFNVVHTPTTFNQSSTYDGTVRSLSTTITFTVADPGETFNRVAVARTSGADNRTFITNVDGVAVTPFDPATTYQVYDYGQRTSWSFTFRSSMLVTGATARVTYRPTYVIKFINTANGKDTRDYVSGYHVFYKSGETPV